MLAEATKATVRIEPLSDQELIRSALLHPRVYPHIKDDATPAAEDVELDMSRPMYLGAFDGPEFLGVFVVHQHSHVLHEIHTCLLPNAWGSRSLQSARSVISWVFENTTCRRLITSIPSDNPLALRLAVMAGMVEYGNNPKSILRGGALLDQRMLGISKD
jgi:RimJ/RimL family protein N-acetyltransferase